jgi:rhodanese-related sulfurtransferase
MTRNGLASGLLVLAVMALQQHTATAAVQRLDIATIAQLWRSGYKYLDVRTPAEIAAGSVPGSVNVPWVSRGPGGQQQQNPNFLSQVKAAFPDPSTKLIVACQTGKRSEAAAKLLAPHYPNLVESKEGYVGWVAGGLPTTS